MSNHFDLVAPIYDRLAQLVYGKSLLHSQLRFIQQLPENGKLLFIGGGSGKILLQILELRPEIKIHYLDASEKMIQKAKNRVAQKHRDRIHFQIGTQSDLSLDEKFDAVITFYFLDLFKQKKKEVVFDKLNSHLSKGGIWLQADFLPAKGWLRKLREKCMFLFFKVFSKIEASKIHDDRSLFDNAAFELMQIHYFKNALLYSAVYQKEE